MAPQRRRWFVTAKQLAAKKYVVRLSAEERERLLALTEQVVELKIVDRASDNTIGRTLKKPSQASPLNTHRPASLHEAFPPQRPSVD
jgi:hypothetical protein